MAFKFRAASGDLSGSPSARGPRPRRDLHGFQDLAELDAQYYASVPPTPMVLKGPRGTKLPA